MRIKLQSLIADRFQVRLDWRAYFLNFCEVHGGDPIEHKGRLLFKDGWTYSLSDYAGPEWEPPVDSMDLRNLQLAYWAKRRSVVKHELFGLRLKYSGLRGLQSEKCCPLQEVIEINDPSSKTRGFQSRDLQLDRIKARIEWLENDLDQCDAIIKQLKPESLIEVNARGETLTT